MSVIAPQLSLGLLHYVDRSGEGRMRALSVVKSDASTIVSPGSHHWACNRPSNLGFQQLASTMPISPVKRILSQPGQRSNGSPLEGHGLDELHLATLVFPQVRDGNRKPERLQPGAEIAVRADLGQDVLFVAQQQITSPWLSQIVNRLMFPYRADGNYSHQSERPSTVPQPGPWRQNSLSEGNPHGNR